jgi:predicted ester cyclase
MRPVKPEVGTWSQASVATTVVNALLSGDVLTLQQLTHPDVEDRNSTTGAPTGWTGLRERALTLCAELPDGVTAELVCSEGDTAVCRVRTPDRRRGFPAPAAPADRAAVLFVLRFRDGLVGELWSSSEVAPFLAVATACA